MSCNYAEGLSDYTNKGILGIPEVFDNEEKVNKKCVQLAEWISESKHVVIHTGAGISTSAGIPDFRGPNGVWTLEKKGEKPNINISFNDALPTKTHMALRALIDNGFVHYIVSQNIDGLHLKSGVSRKHLAELHGNMFVEHCQKCRREFVRTTAAPTVGQKPCGGYCRANELENESSRCCRGGLLLDNVLDWEHELPERDLNMAYMHSSLADLNITLGTTLQITPSGNLPLKNLKQGGKLVICNLQPTKHDKKAQLIVSTYVDDVLSKICKRLGVEIPEYDPKSDPTKSSLITEWTISAHDIKFLTSTYNKHQKQVAEQRKVVKRKIKDPIKNTSLKKDAKKKYKNEVESDDS